MVGGGNGGNLLEYPPGTASSARRACSTGVQQRSRPTPWRTTRPRPGTPTGRGQTRGSDQPTQDTHQGAAETRSCQSLLARSIAIHALRCHAPVVDQERLESRLRTHRGDGPPYGSWNPPLSGHARFRTKLVHQPSGVRCLPSVPSPERWPALYFSTTGVVGSDRASASSRRFFRMTTPTMPAGANLRSNCRRLARPPAGYRSFG